MLAILTEIVQAIAGFFGNAIGLISGSITGGTTPPPA